ncbi:MAG: ATP-binding protein [Planctomycetota bacterium]|jgi:signal transduction histidine kinase
MEHARRVAVIQARGGDLPTRLRRVSPQPDVRSFEDLYLAAKEVLEFRPELLFITDADLLESDLGALRLLKSAIEDLELFLMVAGEGEVAARALADRLDASVLVEPCSERQLASLIQDPGARLQPSNPEYFLDLARGLSDAINNPLLFASGHLQLLGLRHDEPEDREQIQAIGSALAEITEAVEKLTYLGQRQSGRRVLLLRDLLQEALQAVSLPLEVQEPEGLETAAVWGDRDQLLLAFKECLSLGAELSENLQIGIRAQEKGLQVEMVLQGDFVKDWQLPRTYEPYYASRAMRGSKHGLALFLAEAIIHKHGGIALVDRPDPQTLRLRLGLHQA